MRFLNKININQIIHNYDEIIAWGDGPIFKMNYRKEYFHIDYIIDGTGKDAGCIYDDLKIKDKTSLKSKSHKLIIIYTIYENEVIETISKYDKGNIDFIIYSLVEICLKNNSYVPKINGKSCEDILLFSLVNQLKIDDPSYIEVGVCHPIMRNNTYLLYNQFADCRKKGKGVLVEANPLCWSLIKEYRPKDILIEAGVSAESSKEDIDFYMFPHLLGHSTFSKEIADKKNKTGNEYKVLKVPVKTLDEIIIENFDETPDILAIDAEGMDFDIISSLNYRKYPIKIIITEIMEDACEPIEELMAARNYKKYAQTVENIIWVKNEYKFIV